MDRTVCDTSPCKPGTLWDLMDTKRCKLHRFPQDSLQAGRAMAGTGRVAAEKAVTEQVVMEMGAVEKAVMEMVAAEKVVDWDPSPNTKPENELLV